MSDLLASILSTVQDEVDSFWCFVGLMERSLFVTSPKDDSMDCQLVRKRNLKLNALKHICSKYLHTSNVFGSGSTCNLGTFARAVCPFHINV